jgi:type I restriction enzyme M protein
MDKNIAQEVNFVKNLANKLRTGGYKPGEYQNVILPFLLLRRFECIYSETKKDVLELLKKNPNASNEQLLHKSNCYFYNKSELDLEACVRSKDVKKDLKKYIESFSENIRTIYMGETDDDEKYFNIIGHIDRLGKNDILVPIIKAFSKYDLSTKRINQVQMGHIFEALLKEYSENEKAGQHFTPREIIKLKVKLLLDKYNKNETPIVYAGDFACGTGGILSCIHDELSTEYGLSDDRIKLFGQEIVPSTYAICLGDMIIKGQDPSNIRMISTLQKDITVPPYAKLQKDNKRDMDFVCENPPFGEP